MRPGTILRWHALKNILRSEIKDTLVVLDIGGFDGYISYKLKKLFPHLKITVVDLDESGLRLAKKLGLNTLYGSAFSLPIEDNQVDLVLSFDIIEHIKEDHKLIKEISRVLKTGGKIILTTPMQDGISFPFLNKERIDLVNRNWGHLRKGYSLEKIKSLLENNNLMVTKTDKCFNLFTRVIY